MSAEAKCLLLSDDFFCSKTFFLGSPIQGGIQHISMTLQRRTRAPEPLQNPEQRLGNEAHVTTQDSGQPGFCSRFAISHWNRAPDERVRFPHTGQKAELVSGGLLLLITHRQIPSIGQHYIT